MIDTPDTHSTHANWVWGQSFGQVRDVTLHFLKMRYWIFIWCHQQSLFLIKIWNKLRTLAITADLSNFSICGRAFYSLPNSAVTTNSNQKFDFTAHLGNNNQQGYWVTTHVQSFYVVRILCCRCPLFRVAIFIDLIQGLVFWTWIFLTFREKTILTYIGP